MSDPTPPQTPFEEKLAINIANSWKMYSVQFTAVFSLAVTAALGWFVQLPDDCAPLIAAGTACTMSKISLLARFGIGATTVPLIAGAIAWYLRVRPQLNISPAVAAAKSEDAVQPPLAPTDTPPIGSSKETT